MRGAWRAAAVAACVAAACGGVEDDRRRAPAEPELRIWTPIVVRWEPGVRRHVDFAIENGTSRTVAIAAPDPAGARVDVFAGPDAVRVCGTAPAGRIAPGERVAIAPGDRLAVHVDLERACAGLPTGEYRYAVSYRAADLPGAKAFSGTLPARYGQVVVTSPPPGAAASGAVSREDDDARPGTRRHARAEPERGRRRARPDPGGAPEGR